MTDLPTAKNYFFEDFQLDSSRKLLLRLPEGDVVALTHKAFEVLLLLVENRGNLVTKDELMAKVWQNSFVEEANLTQTISVLRKILGENPNQHRFIVTETGKGYRFVAQVIESRNVRFCRNRGDLNQEISDNETEEATAIQKSNYGKPYLMAFIGLLTVFTIIGVYYFWNKTRRADFSTIVCERS